MKTKTYILAIPFLLLAACSQEEISVIENETVAVTVSATLPQPVTRGEAYTQVVDSIVCAVFKGGKEIMNLRDTLAVNNTPTYTPSLALNQTYSIVLFAYKGSAYNIDTLTSISRKENTTLDEEDFEAFAACEDITVDNKNMQLDITLKRAVAKINIGVTKEDLDAAAGLGMVPDSTEITIRNAFKAYNALSGEPVVEEVLTFTSKADNAVLTVEGSPYFRLGQCYFFTDGGNVDVTCDFKADGQSIRGEALTVTGLPVGRNMLTSLVGNMLTTTVAYKISFDNEFAATKQENIN